MEKLLVHQLDDTIEIPEILHFACDDRSQLLDQLKVLQMVLRKERDKISNIIPYMSNLSSEVQSSSTATADIKEDLKEKVERHKKAMIENRQEKLRQIDVAAHALVPITTLINTECENSEDTRVSEIKKEFLIFKLLFCT